MKSRLTVLEKGCTALFAFLMLCTFCVCVPGSAGAEAVYDDEVKPSPIFKKALDRTLNAWERQSTTIKSGRQKGNLSPEAVEKWVRIAPKFPAG